MLSACGGGSSPSATRTPDLFSTLATVITDTTRAKTAGPYLATGLYYILPPGKGQQIRMEGSQLAFDIAPEPFGSRQDIIAVSFSKDEVGMYDGLVLHFNEKGKKDIMAATTREMDKAIGVIVTGRLYYVPQIRSPITSGITYIYFPDKSEKELAAMRDAILLEK